jgi:hypothetical protein
MSSVFLAVDIAIAGCFSFVTKALRSKHVVGLLEAHRQIGEAEILFLVGRADVTHVEESYKVTDRI